MGRDHQSFYFFFLSQENKLSQKSHLADFACSHGSVWCHVFTLSWKVAIEKGAVDGEATLSAVLKKQDSAAAVGALCVFV